MKKELVTHKSFNGSDKIYLLNDNQKHHIQNPETIELGQKLGIWEGWKEVKDVSVDNNIKEGVSFCLRQGFKFQANPLDKMVCTQKFGERPEFYKQFQMVGHNGVDFRTKFDDSPEGKRPVYAVLDGSVLEIVNDERGSGFGKYIKLVHDGGSETLYAHLESINLVKGQSVKAGDQIGVSDNTGTVSTAAHLHFGFRPIKTEMDYKNGYNGYVDPINFFIGDMLFS